MTPSYSLPNQTALFSRFNSISPLLQIFRPHQLDQSELLMLKLWPLLLLINHVQSCYTSHFFIFNFCVSIILLFSFLYVCLEFTCILQVPWESPILESPGNKRSKDNYHWFIQFVPLFTDIFNFIFLFAFRINFFSLTIILHLLIKIVKSL